MITNASQRTGAVLPMIAVFISAFLFIGALTINSNWFMFNHTNVQNTADIAARASLQKIIGDAGGEGRLERARNLGVRLYDLNLAREAPGFARERIRFGNIPDPSTDDPEFIETFSENDVISAVFVDSPVQLEQQQVEVFFSQLLGSAPTTKIFADAKVSTRPVDIMLCLDASRSMNRAADMEGFPPGQPNARRPPAEGSRWFALRDTVAIFISAMREINPNARIGLVTFGGGVEHNFPSGLDDDLSRFEIPLTVVASSNIADITATLDSYVTDFPALGQGTSLYDGLQTSIQNFENVGSSQHILMLSDGSQGGGVDRPDPLLAAADAASAGITVHTIAFGETLTVMEDIAADAGGATFAAFSEQELRDAFANLLGRFRVQLVD